MFGSGRKTQKVAHHVDTWIGPEVTIRGDVLFSGASCGGSGHRLGDRRARQRKRAHRERKGLDRRRGAGTAGHHRWHAQGRCGGQRAGRARCRGRASEGNIYYKVVQMAAGATVTGQLVHGAEPPKSLPAPEGLAASKA